MNTQNKSMQMLTAGYGPYEGSCEYSSKPSGFVKHVRYRDHLNVANWSLLQFCSLHKLQRNCYECYNVTFAMLVYIS
jgi:hypothetical protein